MVGGIGWLIRSVYGRAASGVGLAVAGLANGVGIDLSPGRYSVIFKNNAPSLVSIGSEYEGREVLRCAERPTSWPVGGPVSAERSVLVGLDAVTLLACLSSVYSIGGRRGLATQMVEVDEVWQRVDTV